MNTAIELVKRLHAQYHVATVIVQGSVDDVTNWILYALATFVWITLPDGRRLFLDASPSIFPDALLKELRLIPGTRALTVMCRDNLASENAAAHTMQVMVMRLGEVRSEVQIAPHFLELEFLEAYLVEGIKKRWPTETIGDAEHGSGTSLAGDAEQADEHNPWMVVPEGWLRQAVKLWHQGCTAPEIGERLGYEPGTVTTRLSELRQVFGTQVVPYDRDRRRQK